MPMKLTKAYEISQLACLQRIIEHIVVFVTTILTYILDYERDPVADIVDTGSTWCTCSGIINSSCPIIHTFNDHLTIKFGKQTYIAIGLVSMKQRAELDCISLVGL